MQPNEPDTSLEAAPPSPSGVVMPSTAGPQAPAVPGSLASEPANPSEPLAGGSQNFGPPAPPPPKPPRVRQLLAHINIYLLLFILLLIIAAGVIALTLKTSKKNHPGSTSSVSSLTDSQIASLKGTTTVVGTTKQTLDVQSNSIFEGAILARSDLDVAGNIKVGGSLSLPSLKVSGQTNLAGLQVGNDLSVAGAVDIQGQLTLHQGLSVTGTTSFGNLSAGTLSVTSLQLNGDLGLNRHIVTSGNSVSKSSGTALGSGGTASVSGNDTAGTININTGGSPAAGLFITVNFAHAFSATPHVIITPVGSSAGGLDYYVNRSSTSFSVGDSSPPPAGKSFSFDYFVVE